MVLHSGELAEGGVCPIKRPHSSHLANLPLCQHLHRLTAPHNQHWSKSHECIFSMRTISAASRFTNWDSGQKSKYIYCFISKEEIIYFTPYIQNSYDKSNNLGNVETILYWIDLQMKKMRKKRIINSKPLKGSFQKRFGGFCPLRGGGVPPNFVKEKIC